MDYPALATKANALIATYGAGVVLTKTSLSSTYSTTTHSYTLSTATYSCKGVSREASKALLPGSLAAGSDEDFILQASLASPPSPNDTMTFDDIIYYVDRVRSVAPGAVTLLYKVWTKG